MQKQTETSNIARKAAQKGFTLIELLIVTAIIIVVGTIAFPGLQGYYRESRAPYFARDFVKAITSLQSTANAVATATPYSGMNTANLANALADTSYNISGNTVTHSIQATGLGAQAVTVTGTPGATLPILVAKVHPKACIPMVTIVSKAAQSVKVGTVVVKTAGGMPNASAIQTNCDDSAGVDIEFTFQ